MPTINGVSLTWDETVPATAESAGLGASRIQSTKSTVRTGLDAEHNWPSAGGSNVGYHVYGSARPYYGAQSAVSSSGTDGRLMLTSDTSRLFGVGSGGTVLLGGPTMLSLGSFPGTVPQRAYWALEMGAAMTMSSGSTLIQIPNSGFSGVPFTQVTNTFASLASAVAGNTHAHLIVVPVDGSSFYVQSFNTTGNSLASIPFYWQSVGSRTL